MAETLRLDPTRGLELPADIREATGQIVIRTPSGTIQHWGGVDSTYYGMVQEYHFGEAQELFDVRNPELVPNRVSIKTEGEEPAIYEVKVGYVEDDDAN